MQGLSGRQLPPTRSQALVRRNRIARHHAGHAWQAGLTPPVQFNGLPQHAAICRQHKASPLFTQSSSSSSNNLPSTFKFRLHRVTGDGSCQFRAIVQGVQLATTGCMLSPQSEAIAAQNLRLKVVQELAKNKELMEPFIAGITDNWAAYLQRMADSNVWGGEPELVMAVNVIRRPITVHHLVDGAATPIVTYGEELGLQEAIHLLWSTVHYDLLIKVE